MYEESRRGALGSESFSHIGYGMDDEQREILMDGIMACPTPSKPNCTCETHQDLSRVDASGRWVGLGNLNVKESFPMHLDRA